MKNSPTGCGRTPPSPPDAAWVADDATFLRLIQTNDINRALLSRLPSLGLPDLWLVAGCLFQTVWNARAARPPGADIQDYDLFYHDPTDLSWEAEDRAIRHAAAALADIPGRIELRNQARVHLWYGARFGPGYAALRSSQDGIDRFLVACTCVGLRVTNGAVQIYAPHGLADLFAGVLRPNPHNLRPDLFAAKAASYRARWPWLRIEDASPAG